MERITSRWRRHRPNPGVQMCARHEARARWRSLVVLGLLMGVAGGVAMAAVAGARRTDTAYARYQDLTVAPQAIVFGTQIGLFDADYTKVRQLPEVVDAGEFVIPTMRLVKPRFDTLWPKDTHLYRTLSRPRLREGRLPNPRREDEILVNQYAADRLGLHLGKRVTYEAASTPEEFEANKGFSVKVHATVVGIGDTPIDSTFGIGGPGFFPSGGFFARHPDVIAPSNLVVRLRPGTDLAKFRTRAAKAMGLDDIPVRDLGEDAKRVTNATDLERTGLLVFAVAALVAGLLLVGQALTRAVYGMADSTAPLRSLGLRRREMMSVLVQPLALTAAVSMAATIAIAFGLSSQFPIGLAADFEPDQGLHFDALVLVGGALLVGLLTIALGVAASARATSQRRLSSSRGSAVMRAVRTVAPLPVGIGAGLALERGTGTRSLPVRPALTASVVALLGIVGCLGLLHGIDDATDNPARAGQTWDVIVMPDEPHSQDRLARQIERDHAVVGISALQRVAVEIEGAGLPVYSVDPIRGDVTFVLVEGRPPRARDEVVMGPSSASAFGKGVGDRLRIGGHSVRVVGVGLLPQEAHSSFDQGAWMTPAGLTAVTKPVKPDEVEAALIVKLRSGISPEAGVRRLSKHTDALMETVSVPQDVVYLSNVRTLPPWLAAFLGVLGLAALAHVLATALRRRRHDLAVLRALGFRPRQAASCIAWQAMTVGAVGVLIGVPLGIVVGRLTWRVVADRTPLIYVPPIALVAVLVAIPATVLLANALAALPAFRAARIRPAEVLRTE